jgi:hypothetical protein
LLESNPRKYNFTFVLKNLAKQLAVSIALLTVALSNGWHLPLIQGFAWVQMYNIYTETISSAEAINIILSGEEPCCLCQFVQGCKKENQKSWTHWQSQKLVLILKMSNPPSLSPAPRSTPWQTLEETPVLTFYEDQDTPPPKELLS